MINKKYTCQQMIFDKPDTQKVSLPYEVSNVLSKPKDGQNFCDNKDNNAMFYFFYHFVHSINHKKYI